MLPPLLAQIVGGTLAREIKQFAPTTAGLAIEHTMNATCGRYQFNDGSGTRSSRRWATVAKMLLGAIALQHRDA